jgi:hypothetical protein
VLPLFLFLLPQQAFFFGLNGFVDIMYTHGGVRNRGTKTITTFSFSNLTCFFLSLQMPFSGFGFGDRFSHLSGIGCIFTVKQRCPLLVLFLLLCFDLSCNMLFGTSHTAAAHRCRCWYSGPALWASVVPFLLPLFLLSCLSIAHHCRGSGRCRRFHFFAGRRDWSHRGCG